MKGKKIQLMLISLMCLHNFSYAEETINQGPIIASGGNGVEIQGGIYESSAQWGAVIKEGTTLTNVDAPLKIKAQRASGYSTGVYLSDASSTFISLDQSLTVEAISQDSLARGLHLTSGTAFKVENQSVAVNVVSNSTDARISSQGVLLVGKDAIVQIGSGSTVTVNTDANIAYGVSSSQETAFSAKDDVKISASSDSNYAFAVAMGNSAEATIGNNLIVEAISNNGNSSYGLWAYLKGRITVGDDAQITITGKNNAGAQGIIVRGLGEVKVGNGLKINVQTEENNSLGIQAYDQENIGSNDGSGGKITVGENANVQAISLKGGAKGVYARGTGSEITLNGATIVAIQGRNQDFGDALQALDNGVIIANLGKYNIQGDIKSTGGYLGSDFINGGTIDIQYADGSYLKGKSLINETSSTNFTMSGTVWDMTGNSGVTNLKFFGNQSDINFVGEGGYQQLTVSNLSGDNGHFAMRVDIPNQTSDFLQVDGTSAGRHQVTIQNNGGSNVIGDEQFTIIKTEDGIASFTDTGALELGGYQYQLRDKADTDRKEWEIYGTKTVTSTADAAVHVFSGGYLLNYAETQTLLQRGGELRAGDSKGDIWARTFGGKFNSSGDGFLSGYDLKYWGLQVGADKKFSLKNTKGDIYLGGMFGYSKGDLNYGRGSGDIDSKSLGIYGTYIAPSGFYTDLVLKYSWMKNQFQVLDSQGTRVTGDNLKTDGLNASIEVGQKILFNQNKKDGWYVEPQVQVSWGHQSGGTFHASNGLKVKADSYESVLGRIGTSFGYEVKGGKNPISVYGKISFVHEFDGDMDYRLNNSGESVSFGDSWWTYGLGVTAEIGARHNLYLDVERAEGGSFTQEWSINGGYRFRW